MDDVSFWPVAVELAARCVWQQSVKGNWFLRKQRTSAAVVLQWFRFTVTFVFVDMLP